MNFSTVDLAGNRSSLLVLDRSTAEVRRYALSDLKLVASAKLDLSNEQIFAIRAGCVSDRAPSMYSAAKDLFLSMPRHCKELTTLTRAENTSRMRRRPETIAPRVTGSACLRRARSRAALPSEGGFSGCAVAISIQHIAAFVEEGWFALHSIW